MAQDPDTIDLEKMEKFKDILIKNKKLLIIGVIVLLGLILVSDFYKDRQIKNSEEASQLYQELLISKSSDLERITGIADDLMNNYPQTPYASRAQILYVKNIIKNDNKSENITERLEWAAKNSNEPSIKSLAYFYLGLNYLERGQFESSLKYAEKIQTKGFLAFKYDLMGDIFVKKGDLDNAKVNYEKAIESLSNQGDYARVIEYKLQNI